MAVQRVLVTGASGGIGTLMRPRLRRDGRTLRLFDVVAPAPAGPGEPVEVVTGSVTDPAAMAAACEGADALIHLGGHSREHTWEATVEVNISGTHTVLEAARAAGVPRVILASSNHAVGFRAVGEASDGGLPADSSPRPDTYYGVSKAAIEALGSLYHSRFGMDVIAIRIGSCFPSPLPLGERGLSTWLSPDDAARLFEACLSAPSPGFRVIWGVSNNTRGIFSLAEAEALGYQPQDDAEQYAPELPATGPSNTEPSSTGPSNTGPSSTGPTGAEPPDVPTYVGGAFCTAPLGEPNPL
jgi:nucleoside-diphosphate-sugar epimerase